MTATLSHNSRFIQELDHEIARLTLIAEAESAFQAGNQHEECPQVWSGASARVEELKNERASVILPARGELLAAKIEEKRKIEERIEKAKTERERADKHCATLAEDPTVACFLNGGSEARKRGWGFSWAASFQPWYLSGKARYAGLTDEGAFFMDPQRCRPVLPFSEQDRLVILKHNEARGAAIVALTVLDAETSQLASLIRQFPELAGVS
jgi:hypothetical protein